MLTNRGLYILSVSLIDNLGEELDSGGFRRHGRSLIQATLGAFPVMTTIATIPVNRVYSMNTLSPHWRAFHFLVPVDRVFSSLPKMVINA